MQLDDRVWSIESIDGQLEIQQREPTEADASLHTDPQTLNALLQDPAGLDAAIATGAVHAEGSLRALRQLGVSREKMVETFGGNGLARLERLEAADMARRATEAKIIEGEVIEVQNNGR